MDGTEENALLIGYLHSSPETQIPRTTVSLTTHSYSLTEKGVEDLFWGYSSDKDFDGF